MSEKNIYSSWLRDNCTKISTQEIGLENKNRSGISFFNKFFELLLQKYRLLKCFERPFSRDEFQNPARFTTQY